MSKHELYDVAVSEVRGEASEKEKALLQRDVDQWREALQSVVDEVDAQLIVETDKFEDATRSLSTDSTDYASALEAFETWKSRVRIFKKHISARLIAVKRMCQEEIEGGFGEDTKTARVMSSAVEFVEGELTDADDWEARLEALVSAVQDFENPER